MLRRVHWCLLPALVLCLTAATGRAAPGSPRTSASSAATRYSVSTRKAGAASWSAPRSYRTAAEARAAARKLRDQGYEVLVRPSSPARRGASRPTTRTAAAGDAVSLQQAGKLFRWLAGHHSIAFHFPTDGCYARTHLMVRLLQKQGVKPAKVWAFANGDPLQVFTADVPAGYVQWPYHVAPVLRVRLSSGALRWYVIDPSLFRAPATITQWRNKQKKPRAQNAPYITLTRPGQAPTNARGVQLPGSGYWAGADPREGLDTHAQKVMRLYKRYEGQTPPRGLTAAVERLR